MYGWIVHKFHIFSHFIQLSKKWQKHTQKHYEITPVLKTETWIINIQKPT